MEGSVRARWLFPIEIHSDSTISCCCEEVIYGVDNEVGRWGEAQRSGELSNFDWVTDSCAHVSQWVKGVRYWGGEINRVFDRKALRTSYSS